MKSKFIRLFDYEVKTNFKRNLLLFIELLLCICMLTYLICTFLSFGEYTKAYENLNNPIIIKSVKSGDIDAFQKENKFGRISSLSVNEEGLVLDDFEQYHVLIYDKVITQNAKVPIEKGGKFSDNYDAEYTEIVLNGKYKNQYKVGQIIDSKEFFNSNYTNQYTEVKSKLKVIGFISSNSMFYTDLWGLNQNKEVAGVVSVDKIRDNFYDESKDNYNMLNGYVYNSFDETKYNFEFREDSTLLGKNYIRLMELYQNKESGQKQMQNLYSMFGLIASFLLLSSLLSYTIVDYNYNKTKNKTLFKMGVDKNTLIGVKILSILIVLIIAAIAAIPIIFLLYDYFSQAIIGFYLSALGIISSILIVGVVYLAFEGVALLLNYNEIKREKK